MPRQLVRIRRPRRRRVLVLVLSIAAVAIALLVAALRTSTHRGAPRAASARGAQPRTGPVVVIEYSDYECPYCARAHEATRALLATYPPDSVTLVRRHFPLDQACNPSIRRPFHRSACELARAALCSAEQGRFDEMDGALYRNQRERLPVDALAVRLGLDLERFRACLASEATARRLADDVAEGIRIGVRATPTFSVDGVLVTGTIPADLLGRALERPAVPSGADGSR